MAKTGLMHDLALRMVRDTETRLALATSHEAEALRRELSETLKVLEKIADTKNVPLVLAFEDALLKQELTTTANSPEEKTSIKAALSQLQAAQKTFDIVQNPKDYQIATQAFAEKDKKAGLPLDAFRKFSDGHTARLRNRMRGNLPVPEKNLLRQRVNNMNMAEGLYVDLQRKALGLSAPEKKLGLER